MLRITTRERARDWIAHVTGNTRIWEGGRTVGGRSHRQAGDLAGHKHQGQEGHRCAAGLVDTIPHPSRACVMGKDITLHQQDLTGPDDYPPRTWIEASQAEWAQALQVSRKCIRHSTTYRGATQVFLLFIYSGNVPNNKRNRKRLPEAFEDR